MCGRYYIKLEDDISQDIARILAILNNKYFEKSYKTGEIFSTSDVPILLVKDNNIIESEVLKWEFPIFQNKAVIIMPGLKHLLRS